MKAWDKKMSKIPFENRSYYAHFLPKPTFIREHVLESYWRNKRNMALAKKREAEEDVLRIKRYASNKMRIN